MGELPAMEDYENVVVNLERSEDEDLAAGLRRTSEGLPAEVARHLATLFSQFRRAGGWNEVFRRMHGQTVGDLLKIAVDPLPTPMRKGEVGGTKFSLHEKPLDGSGS